MSWAKKDLPADNLLAMVAARGGLMGLVARVVYSESEAEEKGMDYRDYMASHLEYRRLDAALRRGAKDGGFTRQFVDGFCVTYLRVHPASVFGDIWFHITPRQEKDVRTAERAECREAIANGMTDEEIEAYYGTDVSRWATQLRGKTNAA